MNWPVVNKLEQRSLTGSERQDVACAVAPSSTRVDWTKTLLDSRHPSTVADVPDTVDEITIEDQVERRELGGIRIRCLTEWLKMLARENEPLAIELARWSELNQNSDRELPARLAHRLEPYTPGVAGDVGRGGVMLATMTVVRCSSAAAAGSGPHRHDLLALPRSQHRAFRLPGGTHCPRPLDASRRRSDSFGLYGVADHLDSTPEEALDVLISSRLFPFISERRRTLLHQLVSLRDSSHVAVAEALHISRWTVATYRHQLGIDRVPVSMHGGRQ